MKKPLLLLNSVTWGPEYNLADPMADVAEWFRDVLGGEKACLEVRHALDPAPPRLDYYSALILTGSPAAAYTREAWIEQLKDLVREACERRLPTLGVCFGSQLIAEALGGKAAPNPQGWEIGNTEVVLTQEGLTDPLFEGFPERCEVIQSHQDYVLALPPDAVLLASNDHSRVQAYGLGDSLRAVQFHPEMDACHLRYILPPRRDRIRMSCGLDVEELMTKVHDTPQVKRVFDNFLRNIVG